MKSYCALEKLNNSSKQGHLGTSLAIVLRLYNFYPTVTLLKRTVIIVIFSLRSLLDFDTIICIFESTQKCAGMHLLHWSTIIGHAIAMQIRTTENTEA